MKKFFEYVLYAILFLAGLMLFCFLVNFGIEKISLLFAKAGNLVPIIAYILFTIMMVTMLIYFWGMFWNSLMVMLFPNKYKPVEVEVVDVVVEKGEYDIYYPIVRRRDDFSLTPKLIKIEDKGFSTREEVEVLVGTYMTLYGRDDAPYNLYYKESLKRRTSIVRTLGGSFAVTFCAGILIWLVMAIIAMMKGDVSYWD